MYTFTVVFISGTLVVQDAGMPQDAVYKNKLIAAAGCSGDLKFALEIVAELRSSSKLSVTTDTASAAIRACVACGQPTQAFTLYKQFISVRPITSPAACVHAFSGSCRMPGLVPSCSFIDECCVCHVSVSSCTHEKLTVGFLHAL